MSFNSKTLTLKVNKSAIKKKVSGALSPHQEELLPNLDPKIEKAVKVQLNIF